MQVYYFDGELECFREKHLSHGVIATIIAIVVLLSLPAYMFAVYFNWIKVCTLNYVVLNSYLYSDVCTYMYASIYVCIYTNAC